MCSSTPHSLLFLTEFFSQSHAGATCRIPPVTKRTGIPTMLSWNQKVFFAAFHSPLCVRCCVLNGAGLQSLRESIWRSLFSLHRPLTLQWKRSAWDSAADSRVWFADFTRRAQQATFASVTGYYVTLLDPYSSVICSAFFQKHPAFYSDLSPSKPRCDHVRTLVQYSYSNASWCKQPIGKSHSISSMHILMQTWCKQSNLEKGYLGDS